MPSDSAFHSRPTPSFPRKRESTPRPNHPILIPYRPSTVIPAQAGIQNPGILCGNGVGAQGFAPVPQYRQTTPAITRRPIPYPVADIRIPGFWIPAGAGMTVGICGMGMQHPFVLSLSQDERMRGGTAAG